MSTFKLFLKCFYSPSLYMIYRDQNNTGKYSPDRWEKIGDLSLSTAVLFWKLSLYSSPFIAAIFYRRGYVNVEGAMTLTRVTLWLGFLVGASFCLRSYGRAYNPLYRSFLSKLASADSPAGVAELKQYDFDFGAWPVEFHLPIRTQKPAELPSRSGLSSLLQTPCSVIGYLVLHTVGIKIIYPGSISLINFLFKHFPSLCSSLSALKSGAANTDKAVSTLPQRDMFAPTLFRALKLGIESKCALQNKTSSGESTLMEGRRALVLDKNGTRYKLRTPDGNTVDSMFVDRRGTSSVTGSKRGKILVICSEGNAGFYENGIMGTAMEAGFSVLGWNHPGFGCSTGTPYIEEEESAVNTVMEFAIQRLDFPPEDIVLYGWSIGGYASAWAAAAYPSVKAVVVDATFDDVLPLAINQMPSVLESVVRVTIRSYADLNVARFLLEFPGNIKMVRRADDEIIAIVPGDMTTNRGNELLRKVLKRRYPLLVSDDALSKWLAVTGTEQRKLEGDMSVEKDMCRRILDSYVYDHGPTFPFSDLGSGMDQDIKQQITVYLAGEYMVDYASTHCVPLPSSVFLTLLHSHL